MKIKITAAAPLLACLILTRPARAIQLSLEENRQETGHIGFIDMQRLFQQFPETIRAKENFEEVVRQSEEQVNIRKVELIHLRNDLSQLKAERKLLEQFQAPVVAVATAAPAAVAIAGKPAVSSATASVAAPATVAVSTTPSIAAAATAAPYGALAVSSKPAVVSARVPAAPPTVIAPVAIVGGSGPASVAMAPMVTTPAKPAASPMAALPGFGEAASDLPGESFGWKAAASTAPAGPPAQPASKNQPLIINIPGISTAPIVVQSPTPATPSPAPAATRATASIPAAIAAAAGTAKPAVSTATTAAAPRAAEGEQKKSAELAEMDATIATKEKDLARKEEDFKQYQAEAEKNLLDLESRKTEILLGKIHKAIEDVARQEGVSVVVDKTNILYGHDAVDLTDKVLKYLKSS